MKCDIKVAYLELNNIKNVKFGKVDLDLNKDNILDAQIVGFYGQNGSGKTAIVESFSILHSLLNGQLLPSKAQRLIYEGERELSLDFGFILHNEGVTFRASYKVNLMYVEDRMVVKSEILHVREKKSIKMFLYRNDIDPVIELRYKNLKLETEVLLSGIKLLSEQVEGSLLFSKLVSSQANKLFQGVDLVVYKALKEHLSKNLLVIKNLPEGIFPSYLFYDFNSNPTDQTLYDIRETLSLSEKQFNYLSSVIERNNVVLSAIIPGLKVILKNMGQMILPNGEEGIRADFLSKKGNLTLPLSTESAGTLKLFAITTSLIAAFHNASACVVLDELDAGVFEYLLGELIEILQEYSKGQLFFTSHNLRVLEKLSPNHIWFTTTNEKQRYIKFKHLQKNNNLRDVYLRTILVGGQTEFLYEETNPIKIVRSFIEAGMTDDE